MKKITIEYHIESSFDEEEVRRALNSTDAYLALYDIRDMLRKEVENMRIDVDTLTELHEVLERRGIYLNRDLS
jgi:histone H3/H4